MSGDVLRRMIGVAFLAMCGTPSSPAPSAIAVRLVDTVGASVGGATVTLQRWSASDKEEYRYALTSDRGELIFDGLAPGRFNLYVEKRGYQRAEFPQPPSDGSLDRLTLGDGERKDVTIVMPKLAVVTGVITDEAGEPMSRVRVYAVRQETASEGSSQSTTSPFGGPRGPSADTDGAGRYQIRDLPPGAYLIQTSQVSLQIADPGAPDGGPKVRTVAYAPVVRGGNASQPMMLAWGERTVVDLHLTPSTGVAVRGVLSPAAPQIALTLVPRVDPPMGLDDPRALRPEPRWGIPTLAFPSVPSGAYTLDAITIQNVTWDGAIHQNVALGVPTNVQPTMWASVPITVAAVPIENLVLTTRPGLRVTGQLQFAGPPPDPKDIEHAWFRFFRPDGGRVVAWQVQVRVDGDGKFVAAGLTPGLWQVDVGIIGDVILKSAMLAGQDVTGRPFKVGTEDLTDLILTFGPRR